MPTEADRQYRQIDIALANNKTMRDYHLHELQTFATLGFMRGGKPIERGEDLVEILNKVIYHAHHLAEHEMIVVQLEEAERKLMEVRCGR